MTDEPTGVSCPSCGCGSNRCVDSRPKSWRGIGVIWRRRVCKLCHHKWSTMEVLEADIEAAMAAQKKDIFYNLLRNAGVLNG